MPFKTQQSPVTAYPRLKGLMATVKAYCAGRSAEFASTTNRDVVLATSADLKRFRDEMDSLTSVQGIVQYAKDQEDDQTYQVVTEYNASKAAMDAVIAGIFADFPTSASGEVEEKTLAADGSVAPRTFTAGQLEATKALIDAVVASID